MRNHAWEAASDVYKAAGASTVYTRMPFSSTQTWELVDKVLKPQMECVTVWSNA